MRIISFFCFKRRFFLEKGLFLGLFLTVFRSKKEAFSEQNADMMKKTCFRDQLFEVFFRSILNPKISKKREIMKTAEKTLSKASGGAVNICHVGIMRARRRTEGSIQRGAAGIDAHLLWVGCCTDVMQHVCTAAHPKLVQKARRQADGLPGRPNHYYNSIIYMYKNGYIIFLFKTCNHSKKNVLLPP